jgi:hypothetical protein
VTWSEKQVVEASFCERSALLLRKSSSLYKALPQQHSSHLQLGHSLDEALVSHSEGKQPQSAQLISIPRHYAIELKRIQRGEY